MSFILDALKKSETDRQRQGGPALFEVKVAPPRSGLPVWAVAVVVLFIANLAVVGWLLLRPNAPAPQAAPAALPPAPASAAPAARAPAAAPQSTVAPAPAAEPEQSTASAPGGAHAPSAAAGRNTAASAAPAPESDAAGAASDQAANPDDYAPAAEPAPSSAGLGRVKRGTESGVPLYQQLATTANTQLPQLHLDLHAYADRADDRWVMINMHKLHEGDSLEGVHVDHITPEGAVLSYQGSQFLLTQE